MAGCAMRQGMLACVHCSACHAQALPGWTLKGRLLCAQQLLRAGGLGALAPRLAEASPTYEMLLALDANNPRRGVRRSVLDKLGSVRGHSSVTPLSTSTGCSQ